MVELLVRSGAAVDVADFRGVTPLQLCAATGNLLICRKMLDSGGLSAVSCSSCFSRRSPPFFFIFSLGAAINKADQFGFTPLHSAIFFGRIDVVEHLLSRGADVATRTNMSVSCLDMAETSGNFILTGMLQVRASQCDEGFLKVQKETIGNSKTFCSCGCGSAGEGGGNQGGGSGKD